MPHPIHIKRYAWVLIIVWTAVVAASISWYIFEEKKTVFEAARIQARIAYEKDVIYRLSALHKIYSKEGI